LAQKREPSKRKNRQRSVRSGKSQSRKRRLLKDLLEDSKPKDYIVNSFLPLAPNATLADARDLLDKNSQCLGYPGYKDGSNNGIVVGRITNMVALNAATI